MERQIKDKNRPAASGNADGKGSDQHLLLLVKQGDQEGFRKVYERWERPLLGLMAKITGSGQDAEDIVQETFMSLWSSRERLDPEGNLRSYLFRTAMYTAWKQFRKRQKDQGHRVYAYHEGEEPLDSSDVLISKELELLTELAIQKMPAKRREVYTLHYMEQMSNEQIAAQLDMSANSVRNHIHEARKYIKEVLAVLVFFLYLKG